jgi:hypothetical protein
LKEELPNELKISTFEITTEAIPCYYNNKNNLVQQIICVQKDKIKQEIAQVYYVTKNGDILLVYQKIATKSRGICDKPERKSKDGEPLRSPSFLSGGSGSNLTLWPSGEASGR